MKQKLLNFNVRKLLTLSNNNKRCKNYMKGLF